MDTGAATIEERGKWQEYTAAFLCAIICTLLAFDAVVHHVFSPLGLVIFIAILAVLQLLIQFVVFLHLGARGFGMNGVIFAVALVLVCIVVVGSLWIMFSLDAHMMPTTAQMLQYMTTEAATSL